MQRSHVILSALILAIIGAVAPISLMAWLSWNSALQSEQERLQAFAGRVLDRTEWSLAQATAALKSLTPLAGAPCSAEHIAQMRQLTINTRPLDEVGYFENHLLQCTSWGLVNKRLEQDRVDFSTADEWRTGE